MHPETIAFKADLNDYLNREVEAEIRAERVEQRAKDLMQENEEYYPWDFGNFTEAIENAPESARILVWSYIAAAVDGGLKNDHTNHLALAGLRQMVETYWTECAVKEAERMKNEQFV